MDAMQIFGAVIGVLFLIAFAIERWHDAHHEAKRKKQWWQDQPPNDGPDGDY